MKLKAWLHEYHQLSYAEYKALSEDQQIELEAAFRKFNRSEQIRASAAIKYNRRPMTEEEKRETEILLKRERERYERSLKIGGIDERGNCTIIMLRIIMPGRFATASLLRSGIPHFVRDYGALPRFARAIP